MTVLSVFVFARTIMEYLPHQLAEEGCQEEVERTSEARA